MRKRKTSKSRSNQSAGATRICRHCARLFQLDDMLRHCLAKDAIHSANQTHQNRESAIKRERERAAYGAVSRSDATAAMNLIASSTLSPVLADVSKKHMLCALAKSLPSVVEMTRSDARSVLLAMSRKGKSSAFSGDAWSKNDWRHVSTCLNDSSSVTS